MTGDVVVAPFPFSDLSATKRRPALVVADWRGDDIILRQITSQFRQDLHSVDLAAGDFQSGGLSLPSHIRPDRLFTASRGLSLYTAGRVKAGKLSEVVERIITILEPDLPR
jgi:mRNA interferase MazF